MIKAVFYKKNNQITSFEISGHACHGEYGNDIVCAGISSAVQTVINGITECAKIKADLSVSDNKILFSIPDDKTAFVFINALELQLNNIAEEYKGTIKLIYMEV